MENKSGGRGAAAEEEHRAEAASVRATRLEREATDVFR